MTIHSTSHCNSSDVQEDFAVNSRHELTFNSDKNCVVDKARRTTNLVLACLIS